MTTTDDRLRALNASRHARDQAVLDRITGHAAARAMLADAMSRAGGDPDPATASVAGNNQEGLT
jgi:hypothetical protein